MIELFKICLDWVGLGYGFIKESVYAEFYIYYSGIRTALGISV